MAGPIGHAVQDVGLRPIACWDRGFESQRGHRFWPVVSVEFYQLEVSVTSWSLVQRLPNECDVSLCVWYRNLVNEEALALVGPQGHRKKSGYYIYQLLYICERFAVGWCARYRNRAIFQKIIFYCVRYTFWPSGNSIIKSVPKVQYVTGPWFRVMTTHFFYILNF